MGAPAAAAEARARPRSQEPRRSSSHPRPRFLAAAAGVIFPVVLGLGLGLALGFGLAFRWSIGFLVIHPPPSACLHAELELVVLSDLLLRKKPATGAFFATGGLAGQLVINSKGWFGAKDVVVHSGEGPVMALSCVGPMLAWQNDLGEREW